MPNRNSNPGPVLWQGDAPLPCYIRFTTYKNSPRAVFFAFKVCIPELYDSYVSYRDLYYIYDAVIPSMPIYYLYFINENVEQSLPDFCSLLMVLISRKIPEN
jgi:hypothetical protein